MCSGRKSTIISKKPCKGCESLLYSIIIPVYNVENVLERCIESVLSQTVGDFELLLVDDGSTDSSGMICDEFADQDNRIKVFHKQNGGVSSARNVGLDHASGEYVVFVDSDDYIEEDYLERFSHFDDTDIIITGYIIEHENNFVQENKRFTPELIDKKSFSNAFVNGFFNYVWAKAIKRDVVLNSNAKFDEVLDISEDTVFVIDLLPQTQSVMVLDNCGYHYVKYPHVTLTNFESKYDLIDSIEEANDILDNHCVDAFKGQSSLYVTMRIGKLYSQMLHELLDHNEIDYGLLKHLFSKKWFQKTLQYADDIYCDESSKFRALLKTKSYFLVSTYLKHFR